MIAKIGRGSNLYGALAYNQFKVKNEKGHILFTNKMIETLYGQYSVVQLTQSFEPYLVANRRTEKPVLHISLNPDPKDKVTDGKFKLMAEHFMEDMGYGQQPYVVFKHTDIDRAHIHIVSVCVDETGKKISDKFEKRRSMKVCRQLEKKYKLISATDKQRKQNDKIFRPVDYEKGDVKSQIASVIRHTSKYYQFQTLGEYNALLSLFNITTEVVEGELNGKPQKGLLYYPLNEKREKTGQPLKSSLLGKKAKLSALELHFKKCKEALKNSRTKLTTKSVINDVLLSSKDEQDFKKHLIDMGISVVTRRNGTGRIYGVTFIDHNSKTVWNGSRLGKEFSANVFNEYWNNNSKNIGEFHKLQSNAWKDLAPNNIHELFNFLYNDLLSFGTGTSFITKSLAGFLFETYGEDYEEQAFANRIKKKKRRRKP